jgi:hypothetical protein
MPPQQKLTPQQLLNLKKQPDHYAGYVTSDRGELANILFATGWDERPESFNEPLPWLGSQQEFIANSINEWGPLSLQQDQVLVNQPLVNSPLVNSPFINSPLVNSPFINSPFINSLSNKWSPNFILKVLLIIILVILVAVLLSIVCKRAARKNRFKKYTLYDLYNSPRNL